MDIASLGNLREQWLRDTESQSEIIFDCAAVEFFGAGAAQLLVSLSLLLKLSGGSVRLKNISPAMREDLKTLGLPEYLEE